MKLHSWQKVQPSGTMSQTGLPSSTSFSSFLYLREYFPFLISHCSEDWVTHFFFFLWVPFILFYFIFKLYIIVLVLPNIKMNPPQVYMCSLKYLQSIFLSFFILFSLYPSVFFFVSHSHSFCFSLSLYLYLCSFVERISIKGKFLHASFTTSILNDLEGGLQCVLKNISNCNNSWKLFAFMYQRQCDSETRNLDEKNFF